MKIFLIAGEASGDLLGADLIRAVRAESPHAEFHGAGGDHMRAAGQTQPVNLAAHGIIGVWEVLLHYPRFRRWFHQLLKECEAVQPDAVVLIDYPGFNLRFLRQIRKRCPHLKIYYYVSPQVWAWKAHRARILETHADVLFCIFPFEPAWFREHAPKLRTAWVGHPILDRLFLPEPAASKPGPKTVALLPGSRRKEVERHLPLLIEAARIMNTRLPGLTFKCLAPNAALAARERAWISRHVGLALNIEVFEGYPATHLSRSHAAIVTSGTATVECAVAGTPMVVFYKTSLVTYLLGRLFIRIPYIAMVNLLVNRRAVPELLQWHASPANLASATLDLLANPEARARQLADLSRVVENLGEPGASARVARALLATGAAHP